MLDAMVDSLCTSNLVALEMEDGEKDQRDECDDFAEDFVEGISKRLQRNVKHWLTFIYLSQISMYWLLSSGSRRLYDPMRAIK
jgi:hypothetical protein